MPRSSRRQLCKNSIFQKISGHIVPANKNRNRILQNLHRVYPEGVDRSRQAGVYKGDMERELAPLRQRKATSAANAWLAAQSRRDAGFPATVPFIPRPRLSCRKPAPRDTRTRHHGRALCKKWNVL